MSIIIHGITKEEFATRMMGEGITIIDPDILGSFESFFGYRTEELPPHGRLIDSDALLENINGIWDCNDMIFEDDNICEKIRADCNSCRWRETRDAIAKMVGRMPTIIETEGVKECQYTK